MSKRMEIAPKNEKIHAYGQARNKGGKRLYYNAQEAVGMYGKLTVSERLKDLRVERHLTLGQLAEQTGISKAALGKYEAEDFKDISPFSVVTLA